MRSPGTVLYSYASSLLVVGLFSVLYNPQHQIGWNSHGVSGLISCGVGAALSAVFALLYGKGRKWTVWAGLVVSFLFLCVGGKNGFAAGREWADGNSEKWFRAVVFGLTFLASLRAFVLLGLSIRRNNDTPSE